MPVSRALATASIDEPHGLAAHAACGKADAARVDQEERLETVGAKGVGELQPAVAIGPRRLDLIFLDENARRREPRHHLGPPMADPNGGVHGGQRIVEGAADLVQVNAVPGHHVLVADFDPPEAVFAADGDAAAEVVERGDHTTARVVGIAKAGQGPRLALGARGLGREFERQPVLFQAAIDVAEREKEIAAIVVNLGAFPVEAVVRRRCLGVREDAQRFVVIVGHPHAGGEADPRSTLLDVTRRHLQRLAVDVDRFGGAADLAQAFAAQHEETIGVSRLKRELHAALDELERPVELERLGLRCGGVEVGGRRARIAGPFKVLGPQRRLAVGEPGCGGAMQFLATRPE